MDRFFNTAGPQTPDAYTIDPLSRIDLEDVLTLIRQQRYFVLHAPRQTGKTTCLLALRNHLNHTGNYIAVYVNVEGGQASRNDKNTVIESTIDNIANETCLVTGNELPMQVSKSVRDLGTDSRLSIFLQRMSLQLDKPLVLIIDEIDALVGDSLVAVLRQIRSGYQGHSIMVWGM